MSADTEEVTRVTLGEAPQSEVQSLITLRCNESMDPTRPFRRRRPRSAGDMRSVSLITPPSFKEQPVRRRPLTVEVFPNVESTERLGESMRSIRSPISFRFSNNFASMMSSMSFNREPDPRKVQSCIGYQRVESTQTYGGGYGASTRIYRSMEPRTSFSFVGIRDSALFGSASMFSLQRFKPQPIPPFATCRSNESLDPPLSFSGRQNPGSRQAVHNFQSVESTECYGLSMMRSDRSMEPKFFFRSVKRLPMGHIEPPPSFKAEPIPLFDSRRNNAYMDPFPFFSGRQNPRWSYRPAPGCYMEPWMSPCNQTMGILVN